MLEKQINDLVRFRAPVIDIAHDMKPVYRELFDGIGQRNDDLFSIIMAYDRIEDLIIISIQVMEVDPCGKQLLYDVGIAGIKGLTELGTSVFATYLATQGNKVSESILIPRIGIVNVFKLQSYLLLGIVDYRCKGFALIVGERICKKPLDLIPYNTGSIV